MNILVFLRVVRDPAGITVNRKAQKVFINRENYLLNPADKNALEAALTIAADHTLIAVALGGAPAEDALRQARALGAHRAVLVPETLADALTLTTALHKVIEHMGSAELIVLGADVLDADTAQVAPRLAAALARPLISAAHQITLIPTTVQGIARQADGFHTLEADLPAVVTVSRDSNKPRYANAAHIMNMYRAPDAIERLSLADLGLSADDLQPVTDYRGDSFPAEREFGQVVGVGELAEILNR